MELRVSTSVLFILIKQLGCLITPHAQRERGKMIGCGVHIYIYVYMFVDEKNI